MINPALEKFRYLYHGLTGKDLPEGLFESFSNDKVSLKSFQHDCMALAGIEMPYDAQAEKYRDVMLYSEHKFCELFREKFPDGLDIHFKGWDINRLKDCIDRGFFIGFRDYEAVVDRSSDGPEHLDVRIRLTPDEYDTLWPDSDRYADPDMDRWIQEVHPESREKYRFLSTLTNFVKSHPDLTGGELLFEEVDRDFHHRMTVQGRPFHEALAILLQKPDITTHELRELLDDGQKLKSFLDSMKGRTPDGRAELRMASEDVFVYQYGTLGYMTADRYRNLAEYGEPLDDRMQKAFSEMVDNRQFADEDNCVFFLSDSRDRFRSNADCYMDTGDGEMYMLKECKMWDGQTAHVDINEGRIIDSASWTRMVRLKDRITDVSVNIRNKGTVYEEIMVRCKVDGSQQPFATMSKDMAEKYHWLNGTDKYRENLLLMFLGQEHSSLLGTQDRQAGLKR